jgi:lipoprotein-releasing system permease protein
MYNLFLALRFLRSKKESGFVSFITFISIAGISIGVAALIVSVAVLGGFENEITEKAVSLSSHIQLTSFKRDGIKDYHRLISELQRSENNYNVRKAYPYIQREAVIKFRDKTEGIVVKGIRNQDSIFSDQRKIITGSPVIAEYDSSVSSIIIGNKLSRKLGIEAGDKVFIISTTGIPSAINQPEIKQFTVSGIYESGLREYDDVLVYISLENAKELFRTGGAVTGIEIFLNDAGMIKKVTNEIKKNFEYPDNNARNVFQLYKGLFTWIELQKEPIPVVLGLIVIVAAINIIGFLLMLVLEKTDTIGILKSLGAKNSDIVKIFFYQGMFISLSGIIIGNIIGYGLCLIQLNYEIIKIPEIYYMTKVPLILDYRIGLFITATAFILSIIVVILPSWLASRLNPVTSIRFR